MRTAISAPTRLRLSARIWPLNRLRPETPDLRLRRARHYGAVGIAHHDVAHAHRGAAILGRARSACRRPRRVAAAEILLDRGHEPGGDDVELDRSAGEPPPQRAAGQQDQHRPDAPTPMPTSLISRRCRAQQAPIGRQIAAVVAQRSPRCAAVMLPRRRGCDGFSQRGNERFACPDSSCPLGRPLVRGVVTTILSPIG